MMTVPVTAPYATRDHWSNLRFSDVDVDVDAVDTAFGVYAHGREDGAMATTRNVAVAADRWTWTPTGWRLWARTIAPVIDVRQA
jgi:hypothetical protein